MAIEVSVDGFDELVADMKKLVKEFPDEAGDELRKIGLSIKKDTIIETRRLCICHPNSKYSLLKNYGVSKVRGVYLNQEVDIFTKSPHFHLVEDGHRMVTPGGRHVGQVEGRHMLGNVIEKYEPEMPQRFRQMIDKIFERHNF